VAFSVLTALLFAWSVTCARQSARHHGSDLANLGRILLAFLAMGLWVGLSGRQPVSPGWHWLVLSGALGLGIGDIALFRALPRIGPGLTILLMQCLAAPFALVIEYLSLGTTLSWGQAGASAIILAGVALALGAPPEGDPADRRLGVLLAVVAALGQACGAVSTPLAKAACLAAGEPVPDGISQGFMRLLGGVPIVLAFALWHARGSGGLSAGIVRPYAVPRAPAWMIMNGLAGPALGVACYQQALIDLPSAIVLSVVATTPLLALPMQWAVEGRRPGWRAWIGGALAVIGVVVLKNL
jgi:drug/metabolite transporter (DMT)-like permease